MKQIALLFKADTIIYNIRISIKNYKKDKKTLEKTRADESKAVLLKLVVL